MSAASRRLEILRQIAHAPEGLRVGEIRGNTTTSNSGHIQDMLRARLIDALPIRKASPDRTSSRPVCRFIINAAGRRLLEHGA